MHRRGRRSLFSIIPEGDTIIFHSSSFNRTAARIGGRGHKPLPYGGGRDVGANGRASGGLAGVGPLDGPAGQRCFQKNEGRIRTMRDTDPTFVRVSWQGGTAGCRGRQPLRRRTDVDTDRRAARGSFPQRRKVASADLTRGRRRMRESDGRKPTSDCALLPLPRPRFVPRPKGPTEDLRLKTEK